MMQTTPFPRFEIPTVAPETRDAVAAMVAQAKADEDVTRRNQRLIAYAMQALGKPIFRRSKPKRAKVTRHSRRMREIAVRAAYVAETRS